MCGCMGVCMCMCIFLVCGDGWVNVCIYVCICAYVRLCVYAYMCVCVYACVCMSERMWVRVWLGVYVHISCL